MKRQIISIDEETCNGCGKCIPGCPEGALQVIDGKARLVSDLFCDGLGACLGECPLGAISVEEREAEPYNERLVMENIVKAGPNTILAHLKHLKDHGEDGYYRVAVAVLKEKGLPVPQAAPEVHACGGGCPGTMAKAFTPVAESAGEQGPVASQLRQWPTQLHLMNPSAAYFENADLLVAADCVPVACGDFHNRFLKGKIVVQFCPKLDQSNERYIEKLAAILQQHAIRSITVARMEVPCCGGTELIVRKALELAGQNKSVTVNVVSLAGEVMS
jgi:ferredoxin